MIKSIELDGVTFKLDVRHGNLRDKSETNSFVLVKDQAFLDFYQEILEKSAPKEIMEIGMFEGGSLVYFDKLYKPTKLVGLDIRREPIEPLEEYASDKPHIHTYYGRSQDKEGTLMAARSNFPQGIDLVVDDASHLYEQTKETFKMLFPLVKAGGTYIVEDWAWSSQVPHQDENASWFDKPALTNLLFELLIMLPRNTVIESIVVNRQLFSITKGHGTLPDSGLDLTDFMRGRTLHHI